LANHGLHGEGQKAAAREADRLSGERYIIQIELAYVIDFEIIGDIQAIETIAIESSIRELDRLRKVYGSGRWRKLKGI